jgi:hypothetical protein
LRLFTASSGLEGCKPKNGMDDGLFLNLQLKEEHIAKHKEKFDAPTMVAD